jgi:hypothetical protein
MHRALLLDEVLATIIQPLNPDPWEDGSDLVALAGTCRLLSEHALNVIWEAPPLWHLAQRMSDDLWTITEEDLGGPLDEVQQTLVSVISESIIII